MAIFNKSDPKADYSANVTTVAGGTAFTGKIDIECALHIDGEVNGDIHSSHTVEIGRDGVMKGELNAQKLVIAGKFFGNAECEIIELLASGEAEGTLTTVSLAIESGSSFQGESIRRNPKTETPAVTAAPAAPAAAPTATPAKRSPFFDDAKKSGSGDSDSSSEKNAA